MNFILNVLPRFILILLIFIVPLTFGAIHVWAYSLFEFGAMLIGTLGLAGIFWNRSGIQWIYNPAYFWLTLFGAFICFQMIPLQGEVHQILSPKTFDIYSNAVANYGNETSSSDFPISLNPHKTRIELIKLIAYFGIFFYIVNHIRSRANINLVLYSIILAGLMESAYGMYAMFTDPPRVMWLEYPMVATRLTGSYLDPNHLAGFLEMALMIALGYSFTFGRSRTRKKHGSRRPWYKDLPGFMMRAQKYNKMSLIFYSMGILLVALFLTASRGGMLGFFVGLGVFLAFSAQRLKLGGLLFVLAFIVSILFLYGSGIGKDKIDWVTHRYELLLETGLSENAVRKNVYLTAIPIVEEFPLVGTGLGTFSDIYPKYQPQFIEQFLEHTHNDWLELVIETGFIGFLILVCGLVAYFYHFIRIWLKRDDSFPVGIGLGVMGATASISFHGLVDFNFHIPANAFLYVVILGIGYSALNNEWTKEGETMLSEVNTIAMPKLICIPLVFATLLIGFFYYQEIEKRFVAELNCPTQKNKTLIFDNQRVPEKIISALRMEPMNSDCLMKLASSYETTKSGEMIQTNYVKNSPQIIKKAITLNPAQGKYYYLLGTEYLFKSLKEPARRGELLALSVQAYHSTLQYQPGFSSDILNRLKDWLEMDRNQTEVLANTKIAVIGLLSKIYRLNSARENEIRKAMESYFSSEELDILVFAEKKGPAGKPLIKIREKI
jgi:O-antigen ligase